LQTGLQLVGVEVTSVFGGLKPIAMVGCVTGINNDEWGELIVCGFGGLKRVNLLSVFLSFLTVYSVAITSKSRNVSHK